MLKVLITIVVHEERVLLVNSVGYTHYGIATRSGVSRNLRMGVLDCARVARAKFLATPLNSIERSKFNYVDCRTATRSAIVKRGYQQG